MAAGGFIASSATGRSDVFVLDMRSYREANDDNLGTAKPLLGREQLDWLKASLKASSAQWKVIAADMPIGLGVPDGEGGALGSSGQR